MADLIITIDGPAASGKSTVAKLLAEKLDAGFLDTGAMYRAVTLAAMQIGADLNDPRQLLKVLKNNEFQFTPEHKQMLVSVNGVDVTARIRDPEVTANARYIASAAKLREELVRMQRQFAANQEKIVTEGRDQGTVAFPDADVKFYLTADAAERAKRRQADLRTEDSSKTLDQIQKAIEQRDQSDRDRAAGPLKPADDAILIDTTDLTIEQVVQQLFKCVKKNA